MAKDLFSKQSDLYAKYRPTYPHALIDYILGFVDNKHAAWDCATGNGQAALLYVDYFEKIFATDISEKQIANATSHPKIIYSISEAEKTSFADNTFDLITVSQAYHWLQFESFFKEATRVGKNGSIVACWGYKLAVASDEKIDELVKFFYADIVGKYWDAERKFVDAKYETIPFKFERLQSKEFYINVEWNVDELLGYFSTWSSVQHFIKINNSNPIDQVERKIRAHWNDGSKKHFSFQLFLLLGRIVK